MNKVTLISNKMCPYARKALITASEKNPQFKLVEQDLQNKSQFCKQSYAKSIASNPQRDGAVPILIDGDIYLCQSEPIVWYIAEKYKDQGYNVIPDDHVERFKMRIFIQQFSKKITSLQSGYFGWQKKTEEQKDKHKQQVYNFFEKLNEKVALPYALGNQFTIADILIYTHLQLWDALEHFTGVGIDKKFERVFQYREQIQQRESVKKFIQPKDNYIQALQKFFC